MSTPDHDPYRRPLQYLREGRLIRGAWTGEQDGRKTACLLAAMSQEVAEKEDAAACPADLIPEWVAHLLPKLDDNTSEERWPELMLALAESIATWGDITPEQWDRIRASWLVRALDLPLEQVSTDEWGVREAVQRVQQALRDGDARAADAAAEAAWTAARASAEAATEAAAWTATEAAAEAAWTAARASAEAATEAAAWTATEAAAEAAWAAARAATEAAAWTATEAAAGAAAVATGSAAGAAARAAGAAARAAAWDRMTLDLIEVIEEELRQEAGPAMRREVH